MKHLGLDFLTISEATAPQVIQIAADFGIQSVNLLVPPFPPLPYYDLLGDTPSRRQTLSLCRELGVEVEMIEPFSISARVQLKDYCPALESGAMLGARWINVLSHDTDEARLADNFAGMVELAGEYGMRVFTEFHRRQHLATLQQTVDFLDANELNEIGIEVDALHFFRMGGTADQIALHRQRIVRAQLCDGPEIVPEDQQNFEARENRTPVGQGSFPLQDFVDALPDGITLGIEAPNKSMEMMERLHQSLAGAAQLKGIAPLCAIHRSGRC